MRTAMCLHIPGAITASSLLAESRSNPLEAFGQWHVRHRVEREALLAGPRKVRFMTIF